MTLLGVLHVHDDVDVVQEHPATLALAFAADRVDVDLVERLLDAVDDRLDLTVVGRRAQQEDIGDHEGLGHVEQHDVLGQLVRRGLCREVRELEGTV